MATALRLSPVDVKIWLFMLVLLHSLSCAEVAQAQVDVTLEGGGTTVQRVDSEAYSQPAPNLGSEAERLQHDIGETGFLRNFARVRIRGEIRVGPQFNSPSCVSCHVGGGRGALQLPAHGRSSDTVVKVSLSAGKALYPGGPVPVPQVGLQVRDHALRGSTPDAKVMIRWSSTFGTYGNGSAYELRSPQPVFSAARRTSLSAALKSLRRTPPMFGSGLLEAVPDSTLTALADPNDGNADGISGRTNRVWDVARKRSAIGRFGYKAGSPSLRQQVAAAYATDMGVTNPIFHPPGERADILGKTLDATTFYSATLGVPQARDQGLAAVQRGRLRFSEFGCAACHVETLTTGPSEVSALAFQEIHPFSDLLLHDMGTGLADNRPEYLASGSEWRTSPLWGIGLADTVLGRPATYLHDGRARTLEEAILWHGGEAEQAKERFRSSSESTREDLVAFLRSL